MPAKQSELAFVSASPWHCQTKKTYDKRRSFQFGGAMGTRTPDLLHAMQAL